MLINKLKNCQKCLLNRVFISNDFCIIIFIDNKVSNHYLQKFFLEFDIEGIISGETWDHDEMTIQSSGIGSQMKRKPKTLVLVHYEIVS